MRKKVCTFTQGTEVGLIDTVQLYLKKRQLEAQMKSVESQRPDIHRQIAATKAQIATAQRERDRVENLLKAQAANRKQLDDWDSQLAVLNRQLEAQLSSLGNTTASLTETKFISRHPGGTSGRPIKKMSHHRSHQRNHLSKVCRTQ